MEIYGGNNSGRQRSEGSAGSEWTAGCLVFAFDDSWPVFTDSGVASAKQTGHCSLNKRELAATICSAMSLHLFMAARMDARFYSRSNLQVFAWGHLFWVCCLQPHAFKLSCVSLQSHIFLRAKLVIVTVPLCLQVSDGQCQLEPAAEDVCYGFGQLH